MIQNDRVRQTFTSPLKVIKFMEYQINHENDYILSTLQSSGTHWIRYLVAKALVDYFELDYSFTNLHPVEVVPGFSLDAPNDFQWNDQKEIPRIQHTHLPAILPYRLFFRSKKIILLIRDLRMALASHYNKLLRAGTQKSFTEFLLDKDDEIKSSSVAGTLEDRISFLNSWGRYKEKNPRRVMVLKYEDLQNDIESKLREILCFLGIREVDSEFLDNVVSFCSKQNMKKIGERALKRGTALEGKEGDELKAVNVDKRDYEELWNEHSLDIFKGKVEDKLNYHFGYDY